MKISQSRISTLNVLSYKKEVSKEIDGNLLKISIEVRRENVSNDPMERWLASNSTYHRIFRLPNRHYIHYNQAERGNLKFTLWKWDIIGKKYISIQCASVKEALVGLKLPTFQKEIDEYYAARKIQRWVRWWQDKPYYPNGHIGYQARLGWEAIFGKVPSEGEILYKQRQKEAQRRKKALRDALKPL